MTGPAPGWSHGVVGKLSRLVSARVVAQVIGIGWFFAAARLFDNGELGILAAGLVAFAAVSVVGDMGTTWSIAREATGRPERAWALYRQAVRLRLTAVLAIGAAVTLVAVPLVEQRVLLAIVLGVAIALASGASEIAMSTLRAVGSVGPETWALPLERIAFLVLATGIVASGRGPNVVLVAYLLTNLVTAAVMSRRVATELRPLAMDEPVRLWGAETRRVGVAFAVLALGPRANALVLVMLGTRLEVADYSVASRPVEQLALTVIGFSTTLLPLMRNDVLSGRDPSGRVGALAASAVVVVLPALVWGVLSAEPLIDLLYGAGRYEGAPVVLALVAVIGVTWPLRGLAGLVMVASERASALARGSLIGLSANIAIAIPAVLAWGATGAAISLVVTDVVTTLVLLARSGLLAEARPPTVLLVAGAGGVAAAVAISFMPVVAGATIVVGSSVALGAVALATGRQRATRAEVTWA